jgi:hypothetical protein
MPCRFRATGGPLAAHYPVTRYDRIWEPLAISLVGIAILLGTLLR